MSALLYDYIYSKIKNDITIGKYIVGEMLPSENKLSQIFGTTRMTVRNALIRLSDEGYIYPIVGKGYFVKDKKYNKYAFEYDESKLMDLNIDESKLISVDIINPDVDISYNLKLPGDSRVVVIKRLLYVKGLIAGYDEKFVPYYSGMPLNDSNINMSTLTEIISHKESLFTINKKIMIKIIDSDIKLKNIFNLKKTEPICRIEMTIFDNEGEPLGWSKMNCLMDYFRINCKLLIDK